MWSSIVPLAVAVVMWLVTGSPFALLFAALSPLMFLAQRADARRAQRSVSPVPASVSQPTPHTAHVKTADAVDLPHRRARSSVHASHSRLELDGSNRSSESVLSSIRIGYTADSVIDVPIDSSIAVSGDPLTRRAMIRALYVQWLLQQAERARLASDAPESWMNLVPSAPHGLSWSPHASDGTLQWLECDSLTQVPIRSSVVIECASPFRATLVRAPNSVSVGSEFVPELLSLSECQRWAETDGRELADHFATASSSAQAQSSNFALTIGYDPSHRPLDVDLVDGVHAVIAGSSGSGKSEFLRRWLRELYTAHDHQSVQAVLFDFKGGATFADFSDCSQTVAVVSDLDTGPERLERIQLALARELQRREDLLYRHGVRDISQTSEPRLVIMIDEFAALAASSRSLCARLSDIANRGRSLGIHLVLCTQQPSGVIPEAVMSNAGIRVCLRVRNDSDSRQLVGTDAAAKLVEPGSAIIATHGVVQKLLFSPVDGDEFRDLPRGNHNAPLWCEPLPEQVTEDQLSHWGGGSTEWAIIDEPEFTRMSCLTWSGSHVSVTGPPGSGRTTALNRLAQAAAQSAKPPHWIEGTAAEIWESISAIPRGSSIFVDNLDDAFRGWDPEYRHYALDRLRLATSLGCSLVWSQRGPGPLDELAMCTLFLNSPPGRGRWDSHDIQIVDSAQRSFGQRPPRPMPALDKAIIVCSDPLREVSSLTLAGVKAEVFHPRDPLHRQRLADAVAQPDSAWGVWCATADTWLSVSNELAPLFASASVVVSSGKASDLRALLRRRDLAPLLEPGEAWLCAHENVYRIAWCAREDVLDVSED